jgi:diguanylate cyclase (GGDEF)-like protein
MTKEGSKPAKRPAGSVLEQWGRIQESLAGVTGFSFTTLGRNGKVLAESGEAALCTLLARSSAGGEFCRGSCFAAAEESRRENATRFFRCSAGLQCFVSPVRVDGHPVATVLGGRILERAPDSRFFHGLAARLGLPEEGVLKAVGELKLANSRSLSRTAAMVEQMTEVLFSSMYHQGQAQRKLALMTSLFHLGTDLSPDKDPHEIYALIVNTISILFDVEGACFLLRHPANGAFRVMTAFGSAEEYALQMELSPDSDLLGEVLETKTPLVTGDYHRLLRSGLPEQVRSAGFFPFLFGESVKGLLLVLNTPLDEEAAGLVFSFCSQASTAVQNTILRQELRERIEEAGRLTRIQGRLGSILDREILLRTLFEETAELAKAEQASLMILDTKTNELVVRLAKGEYSQVIRKVALTPGEGLAGKVVQGGRPLVVSDLQTDSRFRRRSRQRYRSGSFLILPVSAGNRVVGVINLADKSDGVYTQEDVNSLMTVVGHASLALQRSDLFLMTKELKKISTTDPLTQLLNRRYFQRRSQEEILRAQRHSSPLSLVMLDLDDFKFYNDHHGHPAGDSLLIGVSRGIREAVRSIDVVSRFGGEEFAILSPQTDTREAMIVAERVRESVQSRPFPHREKQPLGTISLSAGVATYPHQAGSLQELLDNADRALYRAKGAGKNQVVLYRSS